MESEIRLLLTVYVNIVGIILGFSKGVGEKDQ